MSAVRRIGLISDTHGEVRREVHRLLADVELILHAGDVGSPAVLHELRMIAPVQAVRGNTDRDETGNLPLRHTCSVDGLDLRVTHGHELGSPRPAALLAAYPERILVYGHTHVALVEPHGDRLVVNPGAAGPRRFRLRPSVAILTIEDGRPRAEILWIDG